MWNKLKVFIWRLIFVPYYRIKYILTYFERVKLQILTSEETVSYIIRNHCSVARFGDGEFQMITHFLHNGTQENFHVDTFQEYSLDLAKRLLEVLKSDNPDLLICIPFSLKKSSVYRGYGRTFFEREWLLRKGIITPILQQRLLGDSCFTRFYLERSDIKNKVQYVSLLKKIWEGKNLLIVEGEQSRLGVGNDLFDNAVDIHRLLCPATNAFEKYALILSEIKQKIHQDVLILLALGHTATVLAYDLAKCGYQAIDVGHIDIEYEWMRMKAKHKVAVLNKYVNEVKEGRIDTNLENDLTYQKQIIGRIS